MVSVTTELTLRSPWYHQSCESSCRPMAYTRVHIIDSPTDQPAEFTSRVERTGVGPEVR